MQLLDEHFFDIPALVKDNCITVLLLFFLGLLSTGETILEK